MTHRRSLYLSLWPYHREHLLERHDFYVAQVKKRVLSFLTDELIEAEADATGEEALEQLGRNWNPDGDPSDAYEAAREAGYSRFELLINLRRDMTLASLATAYNLWERDLRELIERDLGRQITDAEKHAWRSNRDDIFDILKQFGWDVTAQPFYRLLDACHLLVNVHKHGKGSSFTKLREKFPEYLPTPTKELPFIGNMIDHNDVVITEAQLDALLGALREFWVAMPQDLVLYFD